MSSRRLFYALAPDKHSACGASLRIHLPFHRDCSGRPSSMCIWCPPDIGQESCVWEEQGASAIWHTVWRVVTLFSESLSFSGPVFGTAIETNLIRRAMSGAISQDNRLRLLMPPSSMHQTSYSLLFGETVREKCSEHKCALSHRW